MLRKQFEHWKQWQAASTNRRIFSAMIVIAGMTLVAKVLAAGKEIVVAGYFGTGDEVDALLIAFLLPSVVINVIAGSFSSAVMPTYVRVRQEKGADAAGRLFSSLMLVGILLLLIVVLVLMLSGPYVLTVIASGFSEGKMALTIRLFYWLLPIVVLSGVFNLYATVINACERFAIVALAPAVTPICVILLLVVMAQRWGIFAMAIGMVLGAGLQLLVVIWSAKRMTIPTWPRWYGLNEEMRKIAGQYAPMVAGAFLMSGTNMIDQSMAAMLQPGSVATLNYANKIVAMILGLAAAAIATAVFPYFSKLIANNDWTALRHTLKTYIRLILLATLPVTVLLFVFSEPITRLLFERGAFTAHDTVLVARTQALYVLQIPSYMLGMLGVKLISAMTRNDILMKIAAINLIVNIAGNYIFMQYLGVAGIALSTSFVYALSTFLIFLFIYRSRHEA